MRPGVVSLLLLGLAFVMLAVRGAANWSATFALTWYGVFGGAVLFALIALVSAVVQQGATIGRRLGVIALALPALLAATVFISLIPTFARLAD
jgi:hypothetical protein